MARRPFPSRRHSWLAPEVVQTSAMDCGPASLKCVLDGHARPVSYARLRDACQTDVDGTSIDTMETVANQLGLNAEQIVIPGDHVLLPAAAVLPAIAVVRLSDRLTHFVVVWRRHGPRVQVMDPASGRRWVRCSDFERELCIHRADVAAGDWRAWAGSQEFRGALEARLKNVGIGSRDASSLFVQASADPSWRGLATLDAAARMTAALVDSRGVRRGRDAATLIRRLTSELRTHPEPLRLVPKRFWSVVPSEAQGDSDDEQVTVSGAVLVRFPIERSAEALESSTAAGGTGVTGTIDASADESKIDEADQSSGGDATLSAALGSEALSGMSQPAVRPFREMLALLLADRSLSWWTVLLATCIASLGVVVEGLLFNGLLAIGRDLGIREQRIAAIALIMAFTLLVTMMDGLLTSWLLDAGRRLDAGLRLRFFARVPHLGDRYFHSRLTSDIAERVHSLHQMRQLPTLAGRFARLLCQLLATTIGIVWLDRASALPAALLAGTAIAIPLLTEPILAELELRMRTHAGALSRYYLDALIGLVAVRAHGAERPLRREHGRVLGEWTTTSLQLLRTSVMVDACQTVCGYGIAAWLLWSHLARGGDASSLLILYWTLNIPVLGEELAALVRQYTPTRNVMLRLLEPLQAPIEEAGAIVEDRASEPASRADTAEPKAPGVAIALRDVTVRAAGRALLRDVNLTISPGEHLAIVGMSGAGKSTLVGLLLGWHTTAAGELTVDGQPLDAAHLARLRRTTAWVDPAIQLWNRSLLDNLQYGNAPDAGHAAGFAVTSTKLQSLIERLPEGLQTALGEGGALVSGGEGQRVRLGRALLRQRPRLVVLDEPFRGLDREMRRDFMAMVREQWRDSTLLCVTHDVDETGEFDRVLVVDDGLVVEDGAPADLRARPSRYRELWMTERDVHDTIWQSDAWRRIDVDGGRLHERSSRSTPAPENALV